MARLEYTRVIKYIKHSNLKKVYLIRAGIVAAFVAAVVLAGCGGSYLYKQVLGKEEVSAQAGQTPEMEIALLDTEESEEAAAAPSEEQENTSSSEAASEGADQKETGAGLTPEESDTAQASKAPAQSTDSTKATEADKSTAEANTTVAESKEDKKDGPPEVLVKTNADRTKQRDGFLVVVDAGHGGNDAGANSGEIYEKNINLSIAKLVAAKLEAEGVQVVMTRDTDEYLYLEERTEISNEEEPDLFVSLHCNTYPADSSVYGMDYYFAEDRTDSAFFAEHIMNVIKEHGDVRSRGVKEEDFFVTEYNHWPAVLIEMGFLTNPTELQNLNSADYQDLVATQLTEGIIRGLKASR